MMTFSKCPKGTVAEAAIMAVAVLGLMMFGATTTSAVTLQGDCTCTDDRRFCDPDETPDFSNREADSQAIIVSEGRYFTDKYGEVWYCEKDECAPTGVYVG